MALPTLVIVVIACSVGIPVLLIGVPILLACILIHWSGLVKSVGEFARFLTAGAANFFVRLLDVLRWISMVMFMGIAYPIDLVCNLGGRPFGLREKIRKSRLERKAAESLEWRLTILQETTGARQGTVPNVRLPEAALQRHQTATNGPTRQAVPHRARMPAACFPPQYREVEEDRLPDYTPHAFREPLPTYEVVMAVPQDIRASTGGSSWMAPTPVIEQHYDADISEEETRHEPYRIGHPFVT
ncbi:hypothetical protein MMC30_007624 [Trapelia coarctata]|nr:hypothetical protein [Trapelia coarctata]